MSRSFSVQSAGPGVTVQDMGREGYLAYGLSRGGAADRLALAEGAALLGQPVCAAIEMAGMGGRFVAGEDLRIALTGGTMRGTLDGVPLIWNASHLWRAGTVLDIGPVTAGAYGYLHLGGGIALPSLLGARSAHLTAGLGAPLRAGDVLPVGPDRGGEVGRKIAAEARFSGGVLRLVPSLQTHLFPEEQRARFVSTGFQRDTRANRMGVKLNPDGEGYAVEGGLSVVSEVICPGDVQVTGDGSPFVLIAESQTTGGYPRLGTVIPADLPRIAQAPSGARLTFRFVEMDEALAAEAAYRRQLAELPRRVEPLVRDPADVADLLGMKLVSGFSNGDYHDH